jgi:phage shock protein E
MKRFGAVFGLLMVFALVLTGCASAPAAEKTIDVNNLPETVDAATLKAVQNDPNVVILDVREQSEYDAGHIAGVKLIPLGQLPNRVDEVPKDQPVIVTCRTGNRSAQAVQFLRDQGYTNIHNMAGGIVAWQNAGYPVER